MLKGNVELRHLTTFLAIADERAFGKAAERLGYTQSAVSQQIAALERAVGAPVFNRPGGPRPVELTEAGRVLVGHAEAIVGRLSEADAALDEFRAGTRGTLRVGSFQSVSVQLLPLLVQTLAVELPDLEIELVENDDGQQLLSMLERRELDATFLVSRVFEHGFNQRTLFDDPFVAIAAPDTFPTGPVAVRDLAGRPLIGQHENDMCQRTIEAGVRAAGIEPKYVFRSADNAAVQAMARAGRGVALMPRLAVDELDQRVAIHEMIDVPPREVILIWRDTPDVPPAVDHFVDLALDLARQFASGAAA
jgi:DNA-binding transcriptional LysR family regulator